MNPTLEFILVLIASGVGTFLGSYLKKKGENLATHEDINNVLTQVRAVTEATKQIEAKISNEVWDRQKQWELEREVIFEATKAIGLVHDALETLYAFYQSEKISIQKGNSEQLERRIEVSEQWIEATGKLDQTTLLILLVCGDEVRKALQDFIILARQLGQKIMKRQPEVYSSSLKELLIKSRAVTLAMRKELGIAK